MLLAAFDIFGPIADVLIGIEDQIGRARHVVLAFSFAHEVVGTVALVWMIADVAILFGANNFVRILGGVRSAWSIRFVWPVVL